MLILFDNKDKFYCVTADVLVKNKLVLYTCRHKCILLQVITWPLAGIRHGRSTDLSGVCLLSEFDERKLLC